MSEIKPLFLENGNLRQMTEGFTIDPAMLNGSTVGRFNSQSSYKKGDIVLHDIGQGPAFYEAKENLYPKAFYSGDWEPVGTAITGAKGDQGLDGSPGADAKFLVLTTDSQVFRYGSDGDLEGPLLVEVTANMQNIGTGTLVWQALGAGVDRAGSVDLFPATGPTCSLSGDKLIIPSAFFNAFVSDNESHGEPILTITASKHTYSDTIRILKLKDGEATLTGFLSNSNHTTSTGEKAPGWVISGSPLDPAGGDFKVYRGFMELTPTNSDITYEVGTITPAGGASVSINSTGVYEVDSISSENVTVVLKATVGSDIVEKVYTHAVSFQGRDGTSLLSGASAPTSTDGLEGDFWLDTSAIVLYGPKDDATGWPSPGINLVGAGVDTDGDGQVDAMVANGYLGHNRTIDRSLSCASTVNGLLIGEVTIESPAEFTIADGGIIIIVGEQIGSAITPDSLGDFLSPLAVSGVWGDIKNKPEYFMPGAHLHNISHINGLQASLNELQEVAKANRVFVSDEAPPAPGSPGDETRVGDIWVQWSPQ